MRIFLSKCKNFFVVEIQELFPLTEPDIIKKKNKERLQKKLVKGIKIFLKKRKTKSENMITNNITIFLRTKNKGKK